MSFTIDGICIGQIPNKPSHPFAHNLRHTLPVVIFSNTMKLSETSITKIADALKPVVINYIYEDPNFAEYMHDAVIEGIQGVMGNMDDELLFEIAMLVFDRIELK